jgi:hypothetical protein
VPGHLARRYALDARTFCLDDIAWKAEIVCQYRMVGAIVGASAGLRAGIHMPRADCSSTY